MRPFNGPLLGTVDLGPLEGLFLCQQRPGGLFHSSFHAKIHFKAASEQEQNHFGTEKRNILLQKWCGSTCGTRWSSSCWPSLYLFFEAKPHHSLGPSIVTSLLGIQLSLPVHTWAEEFRDSELRRNFGLTLPLVICEISFHFRIHQISTWWMNDLATRQRFHFIQETSFTLRAEQCHTVAQIKLCR